MTATNAKAKQFGRDIILTLITTLALLSIPLIAMQFTDEVNWDAADFVIAGILLFSTGFLYQLFTYKVRRGSHRVIVGLALGFLLLVFWAELAVGLFGSPFAGS